MSISSRSVWPEDIVTYGKQKESLRGSASCHRKRPAYCNLDNWESVRGPRLVWTNDATSTGPESGTKDRKLNVQLIISGTWWCEQPSIQHRVNEQRAAAVIVFLRDQTPTRPHHSPGHTSPNLILHRLVHCQFHYQNHWQQPNGRGSVWSRRAAREDSIHVIIIIAKINYPRRKLYFHRRKSELADNKLQ